MSAQNMLKIRLSRTGKKSQPNFRVVVQEHTAPIKGKFVEKLGYYRPSANPKEFNVDLERVKHWLSVGAQPSDSIAVLLKTEGVEGLEKFIALRDKQKKKKKVEEEKAAAPAAPATPATTAAKEAETPPATGTEKPTEQPEAAEPEAATAEAEVPEAKPEVPETTEPELTKE